MDQHCITQLTISGVSHITGLNNLSVVLLELYLLGWLKMNRNNLLTESSSSAPPNSPLALSSLSLPYSASNSSARPTSSQRDVQLFIQINWIEFKQSMGFVQNQLTRTFRYLYIANRVGNGRNGTNFDRIFANGSDYDT